MPVIHLTEHEIDVDAPLDTVWSTIADVTVWPRTFGPTVHVRSFGIHDGHETLQMWAVANGEVRTWVSERDLDRASGRIVFRQQHSKPPVARMGGTWQLEARSDRCTRVQLLHDYEAVGDDPAGVAAIEQAVDTNSRAELDSLRRSAELGTTDGGALLEFRDTVHVTAEQSDVYEFLARAESWPERLPHVTRLDLTDDDGVQVMEMDTTPPGGDTHTTASVRVCFTPRAIVYKQTTTPPVMRAHTGRWDITPAGHGVDVTSTHTVVIDEAALPALLGDGVDIDVARAKIRDTLGHNSRTTLQAAKAWAEDRARRAA